MTGRWLTHDFSVFGSDKGEEKWESFIEVGKGNNTSMKEFSGIYLFWPLHWGV